MHPGIRKFWSKRFNVPVVKEPGGSYSVTFDDILTDGKHMEHYLVVAYIPKDKGILMYPFRGNLLSETEMLRIVKLKAFL